MSRHKGPSNDFWTPPSPPSVDPLLVDEKEAAAMLSICPRTLFDIEKEGKVRARMIPEAPRRKLYLVEELRDYARQLPFYRRSERTTQEVEAGK